MKSLKTIFKFNILDIADEHESEILSEMFNIFDPEDINEHLFCEKNNGWESIYCLNVLENQNKLINLFKNLGVLIDYEDLTKSAEGGVFNLTDNTSEFGKAFQRITHHHQHESALAGDHVAGHDLVQIGDFFLELDDLFVDQFQPLQRSLVLLLLHGFTLDLQLDQPSVELVHDFGLGVELDLDLAGRLINQVDRLVGQEAIRDVAIRKPRRCQKRRVANPNAVMHFVLFLDAAQDRHCIFHRDRKSTRLNSSHQI